MAWRVVVRISNLTDRWTPEFYKPPEPEPDYGDPRALAREMVENAKAALVQLQALEADLLECMGEL